MRIVIEYCIDWHYTGRAVRLAEQVLAQFEAEISELALIPSHGGRFEVLRDDTLLFSKAALRRHADVDEVIAAIRSGHPVTA